MNEFEKIATGVGHVAEKIVEFPVWIEKGIKVLDTAVKDQPALKATLTTLLQKGEAIVASGAVDVAAKGLNLAADAATLAQVEDFFMWFKSTVIPEIEAVYNEVKTDVVTS